MTMRSWAKSLFTLETPTLRKILSQHDIWVGFETWSKLQQWWLLYVLTSISSRKICILQPPSFTAIRFITGRKWFLPGIVYCVRSRTHSWNGVLRLLLLKHHVRFLRLINTKAEKRKWNNVDKNTFLDNSDYIILDF